MSERLNVCPRDGEPVVFTFEFPGAEFYCVVCEWMGGVFAEDHADATPELIARAAELSDRYDRERAERTGRPAPAMSDQNVERPKCKSCGKVAEGRLDSRGKPAHWFTRTIDGVTDYACSRDCIKEGAVAPW